MEKSKRTGEGRYNMRLFKSKRQRQLESISNLMDDISEGVDDLQHNTDEMIRLCQECLVICDRVINKE